MNHGGESSRAGTPGAPPAPLIAGRRSLLVLFLLLIGRFLFGFGGGAFDRVVHNLARYRINLDFVDAIRSLDVEGIDQASFFPLQLFRFNLASLLGQGSLLRLSMVTFASLLRAARLALLSPPAHAGKVSSTNRIAINVAFVIFVLLVFEGTESWRRW